MKISRPWMKTRQPCRWKRTQHQMPIPFLPFEPPKYLQRASPTATTNSSLLRLLLQLLLLILLLHLLLLLLLLHLLLLILLLQLLLLLLLLLLPLLFCFSYFSNHFSNQDISDPSLFPPGSYSQHLYPFARNPFSSLLTFSKKNWGFKFSTYAPPPLLPSPSALPYLSISKQRRSKGWK